MRVPGRVPVDADLTTCRYHTGAEQTWTRGIFAAQNVTTENITQAILGLVTPKPYVPDHARSSVDAAGFNEVCIPDGVDLPAVLQYSGYTQTASTPSANTGTELHTTSMVPRNLRTFGSGTVKNPLHGSPEAVKRWALHFLIGFNESLADQPAPGTYFNPVHYAREFIRVRSLCTLKGPPSHFPQVNPSGRVYESGINKLDTSNPDELDILPWIRNYASSRRGATPGIGGRVSKNAYHVPGGPPAYTLEDYFRICPKASRRPAPGPPRHLTAAQDYSEGAGHPLVVPPQHILPFRVLTPPQGFVSIFCTAGRRRQVLAAQRTSRARDGRFHRKVIPN